LDADKNCRPKAEMHVHRVNDYFAEINSCMHVCFILISDSAVISQTFDTGKKLLL